MDKMQVLERETMVRWPWRDGRGPEEWSNIPEKDQEYYRTSTFTMELDRHPEDWGSTKEDYDHADGPYKFVSECELSERGLYEYRYELDESLRDQLEYPRIKHHAVLRIPIDWKDPQKLADLIKGVKKVVVVEEEKCPTCGHKV